MIFEQLCWSLANFSLTDDKTVDNLIRPTKSIASAKAKFKNIGSFYFSISHLTHISNNSIGLYISHNDTDLALTLSKPEYVFETQFVLHSLMKMQIEIIRHIYKTEIIDYKFISLDKEINILEIYKRFLVFEDRLKKFNIKTTPHCP